MWSLAGKGENKDSLFKGGKPNDGTGLSSRTRPSVVNSEPLLTLIDFCGVKAYRF